MGNTAHGPLNKVTLGGLLVTLGIIYGDIGTSPLYVMKSVVGDKAIDKNVIIGAMSLVFWTLTFQTTIKYVIFTLRADNKGEGGIFSLFALIKKAKRNAHLPSHHRWLLYSGRRHHYTTHLSCLGNRRFKINSALQSDPYDSNHHHHYHRSIFYSAVWYKIHRKVFWSRYAHLVSDPGDHGHYWFVK